MVRADAGHRVQGALPVLQGLPRRPIDEVQGGAEARPSRPLHHAGHPGGLMGALQDLQHVGHGRLHAEGDAGEAAFGQGCHDGVRAGGMLCHHPGGGGDEGGLAGQAVTSGFRR